MNKSSQIGIMAGFAAILLITIFYVSSPKLLVEGYIELRILIFFGAIIYGLHQMRDTSISVSNIKELSTIEDADTSNDFVGFSELLSNGFKIYSIGFVMTFFYIYILFNFIDPSLVELVKDATVKVNLAFQDPKQSTEIFNQQIKQMLEEDFSPTLLSFFSLMNMFKLILGFIMSFFVALFLRREQPNY